MNTTNKKPSLSLRLRRFFVQQFQNAETRTQRTFLTRLALLLALCMLCLVAFFIFYTSRIIAQTETSRQSIMETSLNFAVDSADALFRSGIEQPSQTAQNILSIAALSFTGTEFSVNNNILSRVKADLNTVTTNSSLIDGAFLFVPKTETVVSSSFEATKLAQSPYNKLILSYENDLVPMTALSFDDIDAYLFQFDGLYVVAQNMYTSSSFKQSTLFMILDIDELTQHIRVSSDMTDALHFYLYDGATQILSSSFSEVNDKFDPTSLNQSSPVISGAVDDLYVLGRRSAVNSFTFYLAFEKAAVRPGLSSILPTVVPFALVLFLIICLIATFASLYLYRPLRSAISLLENSNILPQENPTAKDQLNYLDKAITSIVNRQEHLTSMLQVVSEDIQSRTLYSLIRGEAHNCDHITLSLEGINSPFHFHATYTVIAIEYMIDPKMTKSGFFDTLSACIHRTEELYALSSQLLHMEDGLLAIVLQFNQEDTSLVNSRHILHTVETHLTDKLAPLCSSMHLTSGRFYQSIMDISFAYCEALDIIREKKLLLNVSSDSVESSDGAVPPRSSDISFSVLLSRRIDQIVAACRQDDAIAGEQLVEFAVSEIREATEDHVQLTQITKDLLYAFLSRITSMEYINPSLIPDVFSEFSEQAEQETDCAAILALLRGAMLRLIASFMAQLQKQRNPYILATQDYIARHYTESELTLDMIAENVHISSNYLSKLFGAALGVRLLEYLQRYRVDASITLLLNSNASVNEIGTSVGFSAARNYIRSFKKYYDCTPGEYRKNHSTAADNVRRINQIC